MYCEKCNRIIEGDRCPVCKSRKVREPGPKDPCFLTEQDYLSSGILEDLLNQKQIPYLKKDVMGAGMAIKVGPMLERSRFYVPFEQLDSAKSVAEELCSASPAKNTAEEILIHASMGELYGILTVPDTDEPVPLIILSHGFGGDHSGNQDYSDFFAQKGFATFNLDFCGGGPGSKSAGTMLEMSVLTEAEDLNAAVDYFRTDSRFSCILLWGASQGGFVSGYVSAQRPQDIRAVVMEFPAIVLQDDAKARANPDGSFPETSNALGAVISRKYNEDALSFDFYEHIVPYTGPVLILHGDQDSLVPLRYSERAKQVYRNAELIILPGQGHGFSGQARDNAKEAEAEFFAMHSGSEQ